MALHRCLAALGLAAAVALAVPAPASANIFGDAGRFVKKTTKKVGRTAGGVVKDVGRATGKAAKGTGKAVGGLAKGAVRAVDKGATAVDRTVSKGLGRVENNRVGGPVSTIVGAPYRTGRNVVREISGAAAKGRRACARRGAHGGSDGYGCSY